jgi:phenylacetate-CoA ligase
MRPEIGDWHDDAELEQVQDRYLGRLLAAAARSPFYQARDGGAPGGRTELAGWPLTTKRDLRDAYPFGLLAVDRTAPATYHESSGSSGFPTASYYTAGDWADLIDRYARKWIPIQPTDMFLVKTPYALMITGHLAHAAARARGATVVPADNRSLAMPYPRVVRLLRDLGITLTWSLPTDTLLWARAAELAGFRPGHDFPALRALYVGGEPLSPARRSRIAELWGAPVVEEYGATETGSLAGQCPYGRLHLWADRALFEVHDPGTGRTSRAGRGQLVVTPLFREAMPLLRYNLEDDVEVSYEPCDCGWCLPVVRVLGRTPSGPLAAAGVTQAGLEELVFGLPVEYGVLFWRARVSGARLIVEIEVADGYRASAVHELHRAIGCAYDTDSTVGAAPPGRIVPAERLTAEPEVLKPRSLFGAGEDWETASRYF